MALNHRSEWPGLYVGSKDPPAPDGYHDNNSMTLLADPSHPEYLVSSCASHPEYLVSSRGCNRSSGEVVSRRPGVCRMNRSKPNIVLQGSIDGVESSSARVRQLGTHVCNSNNDELDTS